MVGFRVLKVSKQALGRFLILFVCLCLSLELFNAFVKNS